MEKKNQYLEIARQVNRVREIYSDIGQPLSADVIADLYRCLGRVQEAARAEENAAKPKTRNRAMQA